jgi:hypothetical protein
LTVRHEPAQVKPANHLIHPTPPMRVQEFRHTAFGEPYNAMVVSASSQVMACIRRRTSRRYP